MVDSDISNAIESMQSKIILYFSEKPPSLPYHSFSISRHLPSNPTSQAISFSLSSTPGPLIPLVPANPPPSLSYPCCSGYTLSSTINSHSPPPQTQPPPTRPLSLLRHRHPVSTPGSFAPAPDVPAPYALRHWSFPPKYRRQRRMSIPYRRSREWLRYRPGRGFRMWGWG